MKVRREGAVERIRQERSVKRPVNSRLNWSVPILAASLVMCAISGLAAGTFTRGLVDAMSLSSVFPTATRTSVPATRPSATLTPTAADRPTVLAASGFTITAVPTPNAVAPGQTVTVVATVTAQDGISKVAGVQISLSAANEDGPALMAQWPAPSVTDDRGEATWSLDIPASTQPGTYGVMVTAMGAHGYTYHYVTHVVVTAG